MSPDDALYFDEDLPGFGIRIRWASIARSTMSRVVSGNARPRCHAVQTASCLKGIARTIASPVSASKHIGSVSRKNPGL